MSKKILLSTIFLIQPLYLVAKDLPKNQQVELTKIMVEANATINDKFNGKNSITKEQIGHLATGNADITSILRINPSVQFNQNSRTSSNMGEIAPQDISINGGLHFQNNFLMDGVNINNDINPDALKKYNDNHTTPLGLLDNKSQGLNLDIDLVDSIDVYDSSVPAKYGGFSGGVIDMKTKDPSKEFKGKISVSHTNGDWTRSHIDDRQKRISESGAVIPHQKDFSKWIFRTNLEGYLTENFGVLFAYSKVRSKIPTNDFDTQEIRQESGKEFSKKLKRELENYFLKGIWHINDVHTLTHTFAYAPSVEDNYIARSKNSFSESKNRDLSLNFKLESEYDNFDFEQNFGASQLALKRKSDTNYFVSWWYDEFGKNWGNYENANSRSHEGGYGDIDQSQRSLNYKADILSKEFKFINLNHKVNFGIDYAHKTAKFKVPKTVYVTGFVKHEKNHRIFQSLIDEARNRITALENQEQHLRNEALNEPDPVVRQQLLDKADQLMQIIQGIEDYIFELEINRDVFGFESIDPLTGDIRPEYKQCQPNDPLCYSDDLGVVQFADEAEVYKKGSVKVKLNQIGMYLDDEISIKDLTLRTGVRYDYDDYMKKHTFAPRFASYYDIFSDEKAVVNFGLNRYYGRNSFAYKLNQEIFDKLTLRAKRDNPNSPWIYSRSQNAYADFKKLRIPYVDEVAIGFDYKFSNFGLNIKYVDRKGKDEIRSFRDVNRQIYYTNEGKSKSEIYTLTFKNLNSYEVFNTQNDFEFALDYSKTKRNIGNTRIYSGVLDPFTGRRDDSYLKYNGKIIKFKDKPTDNFNTPYSIRLMTNTKIKNLGFGISNFFNYKAPYKVDQLLGETKHNGIDIPVIETRKQKAIFTWDLQLSYDKKLPKDKEFFAKLDVLNVLDNVSSTGLNDGGHESLNKPVEYDTDESVYSPGRQFWLEIGMKF
ncbi:MAG: TonB-dependent receptor plug domain-containing protein [Campylobacter sp.]|nr:TonB-dependent receptor plug domain-containing protein [Campylobacter sp.]